MISSSNNQGPINTYPDKFWKQAYGQGMDIYDPYFGQYQQKTAAELANEVNTRNTGYNIGANELQNQLGVDTRALNNTEGEKGTWGSSARNIRLNALGTTYGNKFADLYNTTQGANTQSLIGGEYELGGNLSNLPSSNINQYVPNLSPSQTGSGAMGAGTSVSGTARYNPFNFIGRNKVNYQNAGINYANKTTGRAFPNMGLPQ